MPLSSQVKPVSQFAQIADSDFQAVDMQAMMEDSDKAANDEDSDSDAIESS